MGEAKILPGFRKIAFCAARLLFVNSPELIREGSIVDVYGAFTALDVAGLAGCAVTSETVSGETVYTTTVTFRMKDRGSATRRLLADLSAGDSCFLLTDVYGKTYLLGLPSKPHPSVFSSFRSDETPAGGRSFAVEIRYINTLSILPLQ
jgi:hypothetical protein